MKVNQIKDGTSVSLEAVRNNAKVSLDTKVCHFSDERDLRYLRAIKNRYPGKDFCFLEPIRKQRYLIDFSSNRIINNLIFIKNNSPFAWEGVSVVNTTFPVYGSVHMVITSRQELPHNRRNSYRLRMSKEGEFVFNHSGSEYKQQVRINDISASGIGLLVDRVSGINVGTNCKVTFADGARFKLTATVKRIQPLENGHYIIGCQFIQPSVEVGKFVLQKQRAQREARRYA